MKTSTEKPRSNEHRGAASNAPKRASAPANNGNSIHIQNRQTSGNSSSQAVADGPKVSRGVSELATNERLNSVLSDVMGPQDPAAKYRSETKVPLEGYDANKLADPNHNTPKYIFGRVAQDFKLDSVKGDKKNAEELLRAMVPELREKGLEVVGVEGDRIQVKTEVGYEWVDVIRGAGSENPGWQWGSEGKGTEKPTANSKEWAAQVGLGDGSGAQASGGGGTAGASSGGGGAAAAAGGGGPAGPPKEIILGKEIEKYKGLVMGILGKHKAGNEGIKAAMPELNSAVPGGVKLLDHPTKLDKLQFSNGAVVDVVVGSGGPNPTWGWGPEN